MYWGIPARGWWEGNPYVLFLIQGRGCTCKLKTSIFKVKTMTVLLWITSCGFYVRICRFFYLRTILSTRWQWLSCSIFLFLPLPVQSWRLPGWAQTGTYQIWGSPKLEGRETPFTCRPTPWSSMAGTVSTAHSESLHSHGPFQWLLLHADVTLWRSHSSLTKWCLWITFRFHLGPFVGLRLKAPGRSSALQIQPQLQNDSHSGSASKL